MYAYVICRDALLRLSALGQAKVCPQQSAASRKVSVGLHHLLACCAPQLFPGENVDIGKDDTLYSLIPGIVMFENRIRDHPQACQYLYMALHIPVQMAMIQPMPHSVSVSVWLGFCCSLLKTIELRGMLCRLRLLLAYLAGSSQNAGPSLLF